MDPEQIKKAQEVFREAEENYQILMDTRKFLSVKEQFDLSQTISTHITTDGSLLEYCTENEEYSSKRKTLLETIQVFQKDLIESKTKPPFEINLDESYNVKDFLTASSDLDEIAKEELEKGFNSKNNSELLSSIPECEIHISTLRDVIERLKGEVFNILIMGEYQSGKTTLMDAIIGQYVGAIGDGTATSAVPISYTYGPKEKIKVIWRTKGQLMEVLSILGTYIADANLESFDLENETDRKELLNKLNLFRKEAICPKSSDAGCKALAICSLILRYYGTQEWRKALSVDYSYDDIPSLTRFPKNDEADFQTYWRKRGESKFDLQVALFAFIERIECILDSSRLKELNCTIIDALGLFSNEYDTQITQKEMERADAILYLLPYDKQVGEKTCGSLFTIKKKFPDVTRKLFVVNNINSADRKKNFVMANRSSIEEMFDGKTELHVLDVHLAWLGVVKEMYENGKLSRLFAEEFIRTSLGNDYYGEINADDFEEVMADELYPYRLPQDISGAEIIARSEMMPVLDELINFIKQNKAYSIIVSNGIGKMYSEVSSIRNSLYLQRIEPFIVGHDKLVELWRKRLERVDTFSENVLTISQNHIFAGTPSLCDKLTDMVSSRMFDDEAIKELAQKITSAIYNEKWKVAKIGKNKEKLEKFLNPIVSNVVLDFVSSEIYSWNYLMKSGQNVTFSCIFNPEMSLLKVELENYWRTLYSDDSEFSESKVMSTYIDVPTSTQGFAMREQEDGVSQNISIKQNSLSLYLLGDLMATITGIIGIIITAAIPTVLAIVSNPIGWLAGLVIGAGLTIYASFEGSDILEKKFVQKIAPDVLDKLKESNINGTLHRIVGKEMRNILDGYIATLKVNKKLMENNATIATSTPAAEVASNCSSALNITEEIDSQLSKYGEFIFSHLEK